ncbi:protein kinase [Haloferula sp. BvORR071]|uniref:protein kinase domain-containing protein n=1 Tax=Haloferula sp. BvORR071 TaxID=1396141 RepID=UPI002240EE20|nr:protein kinase [Haloferula sp. BvORR071]
MNTTLLGMANCLECDSPIDPAIAGGLCPKCLLKLGVDNSTVFGMTKGPKAMEAQPVTFGPYRVIHLLGKGGMGSVYEVEQEGTGRRLALKVLGQTIDSPQLRARFLREGQLAAAVRHPHVVGIIAAEEIEGVPVIAMELLHQGNLAEKVRREGPLPPAEAVEAVLQIIDGLQAAQSAGVLHRDVKPANCFISADGLVKVGDFGLSISTLAQGDLTLTQSGITLGTPTFAAPEQLRGEDLDLRADIYSVGATLYFLLTGQLTHKAENVGALIAAVLTKTPADPSTLRQGIPAALTRVVMRCLERDASRRPKSYEALRAALLPFSSEAPAPAMLGLRFIAGVVDLFLASLISEIPAMFFLKGQWIDSTTRVGSAGWLVGTLITLLYFALMEARWGATPGKFLCGLRVRCASGDMPGLGRAFLRASVFLLLPIIPDLFSGDGSPDFRWVDSLGFVFFIAMFLTMRRRNGYAALQDLISRTRVTTQSELMEEETGIPVDSTPGPGTGERIGPFSVLACHGPLTEAWDPSLKRMVWLLQSEAGTPPLRARRRDLDRPARLRWLQSIERDGERWEAFECPAGQPLAVLACGNQPWSRVRRWLLDLATEFSTSARRGERLELAAFNRVWITAQGRAIWLDFPLPSGGASREYRVADHGSLQEFLAAIAGFCLAPAPPLHATRLMETFAQRRLETPDMIVGNLRATMEWPGKLTWRRRLVSLALWPLLALAFSLLLVVPEAGLIAGEVKQELMSGFTSSSPTHTDMYHHWVNELSSGHGPAISAWSGFLAFLLVLGALTNFIWTLITGLPPGLQLFGLVLVNRQGGPASRAMVLTRAFLTCLTMLTLAANLGFMASLAFKVPLFFASIAGAATVDTGVLAMLWGTCALVFLVLLGVAVHACTRPQRALADLILGTTIVPR